MPTNLKTLLANHALSEQTAPYGDPIVVKVIAVAQPAPDSAGKSSSSNAPTLRFSVADSSAAARASCVDPLLSQKIKEGMSYVLLNYTIFKGVLIIKRSTRLGLTKAIDVPNDIASTASELIQPVNTPVSPTRVVQNMPTKSQVSIEGTVTKVEPETTVEFDRKPVAVKNIVVADASGDVKVGLWRSYAGTDVGVGQHIAITNATTKLFNNEIVVNTTSRTQIEVTAPVQTQQHIDVVGLDDFNDDFVVFLCRDGTLKQVNFADLHDKSVEELLDMLPFEATLTMRGIDIEALEFL